jgi:hypothetical protein
MLWDFINCHLAGRHEYAIWCADNRIVLRCLRCGRHSKGWDVGQTPVEASRTLTVPPAGRDNTACLSRALPKRI